VLNIRQNITLPSRQSGRLDGYLVFLEQPVRPSRASGLTGIPAAAFLANAGSAAIVFAAALTLRAADLGLPSPHGRETR